MSDHNRVEHQDYPHTPGTLPGCPACDIELARQAYVQAQRGLCPAEHMEMLDQRGQRMVENALLANQVAAEENIPVRDALHKLPGVPDKTKAQIAEWVAPEFASDWSGTWDERDEAKRAAEGRERDRREDQVFLANAKLDPNDLSPEAMQIRETAASIRDHRAMAHRRRAWDLRDEEAALIANAVKAYAERDRHREDAKRFRDEKDWQSAAISALAMKQADNRGERATFESIEAGYKARHHEALSTTYLRDNQSYEEQFPAHACERCGGSCPDSECRARVGRRFDDHEGSME